MTDNFVYLSEVILRDICHSLAVKYFSVNGEPIGDFYLSDFGKISSALANPSRKFNGIDLYATLYEKGAILVYSLVKAHAFSNGNKRIALVALLVFLGLNGKYLDVDRMILADKMVEIAESRPDMKDQVLKSLAKYLEQYCTDMEPILL